MTARRGSRGGSRAGAPPADPQRETPRLEITEELTVHTAADQAARLLAEVAALPTDPAGGEVVLDLSTVPELDTAGLQVLLLLRRELRSRGWRPTLTPSDPVTQVLALAGLGPEAWQEAAA